MAAPLGSADWHRLAEQCRARADKMQDPMIRERMLTIADGYDCIAHDAEKDRGSGHGGLQMGQVTRNIQYGGKQQRKI